MDMKTSPENPRDEQAREVLFQESPLPQWIQDPETGRFLEVNQAALSQYGYSRQEFLALTLSDLHPPQ